MWEVDPERRSKLQQIQKKEGSGNDRCCDCGAPSPQWASPKFSTFMCLTCAGIHRGLGVHISFIRSISMDVFKQNEMLRMEHGGNKAWQDFYNANITAESAGKTFESSSIKERYESDVGDEWKERLSAKVEDKPFDRGAWSRERGVYNAKVAAKSGTGSPPIYKPTTDTSPTYDCSSGYNDRQTAASNRGTSPTQKERNEAYFSNLGAANTSRPDSLAPSRGGRYAGFGSSNSNNITSTDPPQQPHRYPTDPQPLKTLTTSLSWFTTSLSRTAKSVNDTYIQPTAKNIAASDLAAQARSAALQAGSGIQTTARSAGQSFNRFVEGQDGAAAAGTGAAGTGAAAAGAGPENRDFWDTFGEPPTATATASTTSTTVSTGGGNGSGNGNGNGNGNGSGSGINDDHDYSSTSSSIGTAALKKKGW